MLFSLSYQVSPRQHSRVSHQEEEEEWGLEMCCKNYFHSLSVVHVLSDDASWSEVQATDLSRNTWCWYRCWLNRCSHGDGMVNMCISHIMNIHCAWRQFIEINSFDPLNQICLKTFSRRPHLQEHMILHTQDRPFKCSFCDEYFKSRFARLKHQEKYHLGENCTVKNKLYRQIRIF